MSRAADEKKFNGKGGKDKKPGARSRFLDFNAREDEKEAIRALGNDVVTYSLLLDEILDSGLRLSVSFDEHGGAYKVLVFHEATPFDDRTFVTFWASGVLWALVQCAYAWKTGILSVDEGIVYRRQSVMAF